MTRQKSVLRQIALRLPEIASFCCAALMLCVIPLYFDDAFFNINRCKVSLIRTATPWLLALMAVSLCASRLPGEKKRLERPIAPDICMAAFLLACVIACARQGFNEDVTEAANGRNLGLWLMLCLCAAYYIVALGVIDGCLLAACMLLCAAICAGLGILNAAGIDPLGFYQNIKRKLKITFFSTIGNADFFGTYLLMMFGMAAGVMLFSKKRVFRLSAAGCAILLILGMLVSRTDSAAAGMLLVCLTMLVLSCGNWVRMGCAAILLAVCLALIPAAQAVLNKNPYHPQMDGLLSLLMKTHAVHVLPVVLVVAAAVFTWLGRRVRQVPNLVVDAHSIGPGQTPGIIPAAGNAVVVGPLQVTGGGVANEQAILSGDAGNTGENIVKIGYGGLARPGVLRDKGVRDIRPEVAGGQAGLLHGSHSIGNNI